MHSIVSTEGSRWCEVIRQKSQEGEATLHVHACSPSDATEGLQNWLNLGYEKASVSVILHVNEDESRWAQPDDSAFTPANWKMLLQKVSENELFPCEYKDNNG